LVERPACDVKSDVIVADAVLQRGGVPPEGPARQFQLAALIGESVLHADRDRATECIESVEGARADELDPVDRNVGNEIPIDGAAERLVDANPVLVDRQSLRRAEHG